PQARFLGGEGRAGSIRSGLRLAQLGGAGAVLLREQALLERLALRARPGSLRLGVVELRLRNHAGLPQPPGTLQLLVGGALGGPRAAQLRLGGEHVLLARAGAEQVELRLGGLGVLRAGVAN